MDSFIERVFGNKIIIILVSLLLIIALVYYGIIKINSRNFNDKKIDKNKYVVYTKETRQKDFYIQDIPFINLKGETIEVINEDINNYLETFNKDNIEVSYEYSVNGIILSVVLKVEDHSKLENASITYYRSYNINTENMELLSNPKILSFFDITEQEVNSIIEYNLKDYYNNLVKSKKINKNECNYNCFLNNRGINTNYIDNIAYYIRDGKLIVFKPITFIPLYEEEKIIDEIEVA